MFLGTIDQNVAIWFLGIRSELLTLFSLCLSYLANPTTLIIIAGLFSTYLYKTRQTKYILPLFLGLTGSILSVFVFKHIFQSPRPIGLELYQIEGYGFPSVHATLATTFYGLLAYWSVREIKNNYRYLVVLFFVLLILSISASRIYLGVHYFSDILAGTIVGAIWIWLGLGVLKSKI